MPVGLMARFVFILMFLSGQAPAVLESERELRAIEKAHAAVAEVRTDFRNSLNEALKKGELKKALPGCRIKKLKPEAMKVGRTSHRLRNQSNVAPEWTKSYLQKFSQMSSAQIPKQVLTKIGPHRFGYLEPIFVEPICLNCHGRNVQEDVKQAIRENYPNDQALNFDAGDFRGLIWLEVSDDAK